MAKRKSNTKHPKLPNGFGRITEIKSYNLRRPFRAMVTVGRDEEGRPIGVRFLGISQAGMMLIMHLLNITRIHTN